MKNYLLTKENSRILDCEIQKRILCIFTKQINPRSLGSWGIKGTKESFPRVDSLLSFAYQEISD